MSFKKYDFVSIDIETMNLTEDQILFESGFLSGRKGTKDPEKIKQQIENKINGLKEKGAVKNSSNIASIGIHTDNSRPVVIHQFPFTDDLDSVDHVPCCNEREMLLSLTNLLNSCCDDETEIVVAGKKFDLPKIMLASIRNRVNYPECFTPGRNKIYDLLYFGGKYFMVDNQAQYTVSVGELLKRFGFDREGKIVGGSEIPTMIENEQYKEVIIYNGLDVIDNTLLYKAMTNQTIHKGV